MNTQSLYIQNHLLSKQEINLLPNISFDGDIVVIQNKEELQAHIQHLKNASILGFDTETKPSFKKGVIHNPSILQLSTAQKVYVIQIKHTGLTAELVDILTNPYCIKVGVAVNDDINGLNRLEAFKAQGFVDLASLAKQKGVEAQGLRTLTANLLGYKLSKNSQCSNWAHDVLTHQQIRYAATDAWISLVLFYTLQDLEDVK